MSDNLTVDESLDAICDFMLDQRELMLELLERSTEDKKERCFRACAEDTPDGTEVNVNRTKLGDFGSCAPNPCPGNSTSVGWYHTHPPIVGGTDDYSAHDWLKSIHEQTPIMCLGSAGQVGCQKINPLIYAGLHAAVNYYRHPEYDLGEDANRYHRSHEWGDFGKLLGHLVKFEEDMAEAFKLKKEITPEMQRNADIYDDLMDEINQDVSLAVVCKEKCAQ